MKREIKGYKYLCIVVCVFLLFSVGLETPSEAKEKFPTRPVELIVPTPPGGGTDIMSRILIDGIESFLGKKVVVVNKPGGAGSIGTTTIVEAKPDGYTLGCLWNAPLTMLHHTLKVSYTLDDFSYIAQISKGPFLFCVRSEFPAKNAEEFFEYVRKNPGKLTYANDGVGGTVQFAGERVFHALKVKLRPVPYGGAGESIKALLGGHVDVYGGSVPPALPHIKAGTVRPIFVTTRERIKVLPEVAGVSDLGHPETEFFLWRGIVGPKGIPADRLVILEKAFREAAQTDKMRGHLDKLGEMVTASTGKEFEELVRSEFAAVAIIAKEIGLAPK